MPTPGTAGAASRIKKLGGRAALDGMWAAAGLFTDYRLTNMLMVCFTASTARLPHLWRNAQRWEWKAVAAHQRRQSTGATSLPWLAQCQMECVHQPPSRLQLPQLRRLKLSARPQPRCRRISHAQQDHPALRLPMVSTLHPLPAHLSASKTVKTRSKSWRLSMATSAPSLAQQLNPISRESL